MSHCHAEWHDTPCPQPCAACAAECDPADISDYPGTDEPRLTGHPPNPETEDDDGNDVCYHDTAMRLGVLRETGRPWRDRNLLGLPVCEHCERDVEETQEILEILTGPWLCVHGVDLEGSECGQCIGEKEKRDGAASDV